MKCFLLKPLPLGGQKEKQGERLALVEQNLEPATRSATTINRPLRRRQQHEHPDDNSTTPATRGL